MQNLSFLYTVYFYTNQVQYYAQFPVLHSVCSFTLSVYFYTRCVVYEHALSNFTLNVQFYNQCVVLQSVLVLHCVQFYTQCVVLHTVYNLTACTFTRVCDFTLSVQYFQCQTHYCVYQHTLYFRISCISRDTKIYAILSRNPIFLKLRTFGCKILGQKILPV